MRLAELFEARKNPKLNPKEDGHAAAAKFLNSVPASQIEKYGVSMTELPKLGINPKSNYNTPIGVYAYPANYYEEIKSPNTDDLPLALLPFQDEAPYIQIFKVNSDNILNLEKVDVDQYNTYIKKLIQSAPEIAHISGETKKDVIDQISKIMLQAPSEANVKTYAGYLWYVLYKLSGYLGDGITTKRGQVKRSPVLWNKLFRMLDIDAVYDPGTSIVHENEPEQFVVLDTSKIQLVKTFTNQASKKEISPWFAIYNASQDKTGIDFLRFVTKQIQDQSLYMDDAGHKVGKALVDKAVKLFRNDPGLFDQAYTSMISTFIKITNDKQIKDFLKVGSTLSLWYSLSTKYETLMNLIKDAVVDTSPLRQVNIANTILYDIDIFSRIMVTLRSVPPNPEITDILKSLDDLIDAHAYLSELGQRKSQVPAAAD